MPQMHGAICGDVQDVRYGESGISKRQQFGVSPDERHLLCKWQNAGTWYPVRGTQYVVPSTWYPVRGTQSFVAMYSDKTES